MRVFSSRNPTNLVPKQQIPVCRKAQYLSHRSFVLPTSRSKYELLQIGSLRFCISSGAMRPAVLCNCFIFTMNSWHGISFFFFVIFVKTLVCFGGDLVQIWGFHFFVIFVRTLVCFGGRMVKIKMGNQNGCGVSIGTLQETL